MLFRRIPEIIMLALLVVLFCFSFYILLLIFAAQWLVSLSHSSRLLITSFMSSYSFASVLVHTRSSLLVFFPPLYPFSTPIFLPIFPMNAFFLPGHLHLPSHHYPKSPTHSSNLQPSPSNPSPFQSSFPHFSPPSYPSPR